MVSLTSGLSEIRQIWRTFAGLIGQASKSIKSQLPAAYGMETYSWKRQKDQIHIKYQVCHHGPKFSFESHSTTLELGCKRCPIQHKVRFAAKHCNQDKCESPQDDNHYRHSSNGVHDSTSVGNKYSAIEVKNAQFDEAIG